MAPAISVQSYSFIVIHLFYDCSMIAYDFYFLESHEMHIYDFDLFFCSFLSWMAGEGVKENRSMWTEIIWHLADKYKIRVDVYHIR